MEGSEDRDPRIQILTIEKLPTGKGVAYPRLLEVTFKEGTEKRGAPKARPRLRRNKLNQQQRFSRTNSISNQSQRPKPADCIDCREMSEVDAIPCIRNLNSSAFDALSRAVS